LIHDYPSVIRHQGQLADNLSKFGFLLEELARPDEALRSHREALAIGDTRLKHRSNDPYARAERADTINGIAGLEHKQGRIDVAVSLYEETREVIRGLVAEDPHVVRLRQALSIGDNGLAAVRNKVGRSREAVVLLDEAQPIFESLLTTWPKAYTALRAVWRLGIPPDVRGWLSIESLRGRLSRHRPRLSLLLWLASG
jgi:tetratricopeptide (TPR) repeat protein